MWGGGGWGGEGVNLIHKLKLVMAKKKICQETIRKSCL